jgi:hypothetical protein
VGRGLLNEGVETVRFEKFQVLSLGDFTSNAERSNFEKLLSPNANKKSNRLITPKDMFSLSKLSKQTNISIGNIMYFIIEIQRIL